MKVAVTADLHLTSPEKHPERYNALRNIFDQALADGIDTVINAGDLFNESDHSYTALDALLKDDKYAKIKLIAIPGNHDAHISDSLFTAENICVHTEPTIQVFDEKSLKIILIPYRKNESMGEYIANMASELPKDKWLLIGHGDWYAGLREPNPYEPGVYMPLTRPDVQTYRPINVILGHIHKPASYDIVHYTGSPCGIDITETGHRRFLILDTLTGQIESRTVNTDFIFCDETLTVFPHENELVTMQKKIDDTIGGWAITDHEIGKVITRIKVVGYTTDRAKLMSVVRKGFDKYAYYNEEPPDDSELRQSEDLDREAISTKVAAFIADLEWPESIERPSKDQILLHALRVIYEAE